MDGKRNRIPYVADMEFTNVYSIRCEKNNRHRTVTPSLDKSHASSSCLHRPPLLLRYRHLERQICSLKGTGEPQLKNFCVQC
jgi:hypothetical protein